MKPLAVLLLALSAAAQPSTQELHDRVRTLEHWVEQRDRDTPMNPRVYVDRVERLEQRVTEDEAQHSEDIRTAISTIGAALGAAVLYFFRKHYLEAKEKA